MSATAVRVRGLTKRFGDVIALDGVDLDIPAGQVHGLVGPNGAGKTTLLGLLLGLSRATSGGARGAGSPGRVAGREHRLRSPGSSTGPASTRASPPGRTSRPSPRCGPAGAARTSTRCWTASASSTWPATPSAGFSLGMRQRLGLAAALLGEPRLLVVDEPANGLDPAGKRQVHRVLTDLAGDGRHRGPLQPPDGRPGRALRRGDTPGRRPGRVHRPDPQAGRRERGPRPPAGDLRPRRCAAARRQVRRRCGSWPAARRSSTTRALVVRGPEAALDDARRTRLVAGGVAIRGLSPVVPPLEAAFLALTGPMGDDTDRDRGGRDDDHDARRPAARRRGRGSPARRLPLRAAPSSLRSGGCASPSSPACSRRPSTPPSSAGRRRCPPTRSTGAGWGSRAGRARWPCSSSWARWCCRCSPPWSPVTSSPSRTGSAPGATSWSRSARRG